MLRLSIFQVLFFYLISLHTTIITYHQYLPHIVLSSLETCLGLQELQEVAPLKTLTDPSSHSKQPAPSIGLYVPGGHSPEKNVFLSAIFSIGVIMLINIARSLDC